MTLDPIVTGELVCDVHEASCRCIKPPDHNGPHRCSCGGQWTFDDDGQFIIVTLPTV